MDLQAAQATKEKRSVLSRVIVMCCLALTAALLITSLASPGRALSKNPAINAVLPGT